MQCCCRICARQNEAQGKTWGFTCIIRRNEPYTLWLYSAKGNAKGNAAFTVSGATKGAEKTWSLGATKMLTRFDVKSDANGVISGTFAAADGNGGAFNGLTLVGVLPKTGTTVIIR
ncbi:MAG: hypothetical protein IJH50_14245 [Kiritimatiellae bacterium]|nr:hypothetical protein [Kiritimatiellia bacterium]